MEPWSHVCWSWRHRHHFTQEQAAREVGISLTTWSRWERGRTEPDAEEARHALRLMTQLDGNKRWALEDRGRVSGLAAAILEHR